MSRSGQVADYSNVSNFRMAEQDIRPPLRSPVIRWRHEAIFLRIVSRYVEFLRNYTSYALFLVFFLLAKLGVSCDKSIIQQGNTEPLQCKI